MEMDQSNESILFIQGEYVYSQTRSVYNAVLEAKI